MTVKSEINQDLKDERDKILFNVEEFTNWYYGGDANVKDKRYLGECRAQMITGDCQSFDFSHVENLILNDPELKLDIDMSYMSHKEKYEEAVRRATIALKLFKKLQQEGFGGADFVGYVD